ncbi:MAG: hypothetical protein AAFQ73_17090, partial [Pseudomonadota bacterium]
TAHICTIPSATVTQALAAAGADAVIIDLEHGAVDYASAHAMIAAVALNASSVFVIGNALRLRNANLSEDPS